MEAKEIRIGNYILDSGNKMWQIDHWEHSTKVSAKSPFLGYFANSDIEMYGHPFTEDLEFLKPVPISEELLLSFGFLKDNYETYVLNLKDKSKNFLWLKYKNEDTVVDFDVALNLLESADPCYLNSIKFVHQLQNLYFSLTASELQLKK